jgi:hypothetical protein
MRHLLTLLCLLLITAVACSRPAESTGDADVGEEDARFPDTGESDGGPEPDVTPEPDVVKETCPGDPVCAQNERLVNCVCVNNMDRRCTRDSHCRDGESCQDFDGRGVCMFEPGPPIKCPGAEHCPAGGDGVLYVGAASKVITPDGFETPTEAGLNGAYLNFSPPAREGLWNDCGIDGLCPGDPGYPGPDEGEGDGIMQGMWLAGFATGRPALYCPEELIGCDRPECCVSKFAHDDLLSQVVVFRQNQTTVAFVVLDVVGYFHTDIEKIRARIPAELGIDLLILASTHNHEAPDTAGQWGPGRPAPTETGRSPSFMEKIIAQTVEGIAEAVAALEPADVRTTVIQTGVEGLAIGDSRPPYIFDDNLPVVHVTSKATGQTIATLMSFGNHAEVLWSNNSYITSDFFHFARKYVEEGLAAVVDEDGNELKPALPGVGGVTALFAGAIGGLINPGRGGAKDYAGVSFDGELRHTFAAADAVGQTLAAHVLRAMAGDELQAVDNPSLTFAHRQFLSPIVNTVFQLAAFVVGLLERDVYNAGRQGLNFYPGPPKILTEVAVVRLGPITFFTAPGEVFPETLVGGFPGKPRIWDPVVGDVEERLTPATCDADGLPTPNDDGTYPCIVRKNHENPPDWSKAPDGPYVYELIPGEVPFFIGVAMDFLGYMVPEYDYEVAGYISQPPGSHYEETNGIGPDIIVDWKAALGQVLELVR